MESLSIRWALCLFSGPMLLTGQDRHQRPRAAWPSSQRGRSGRPGPGRVPAVRPDSRRGNATRIRHGHSRPGLPGGGVGGSGGLRRSAGPALPASDVRRVFLSSSLWRIFLMADDLVTGSDGLGGRPGDRWRNMTGTRGISS